MSIKRTLPEPADSDRPRKQSSSPLFSPRSSRSPRIMPAPLEESEQLLKNYYDTDSSSTPRAARLSSHMDMDSSDELPTSPTPRVATHAQPDTSPIHARVREDSVASSNFDLATLSPDTRDKHYARAFEVDVVPLKDLRAPPPCQQYPHIAEEIFQGYLRHATFVVRVWVNYDCHTCRFFLKPSRVEDCGKIYLSPTQREYLETFGDELEFSTLRLDISTPFRVVARMCIDVRHFAVDEEAEDSFGMEELSVGACMVDPNTGKAETGRQSELKYLPSFIRRVRDYIRNYPIGKWKGQHGLRLLDLDRIASCMVFRPQSEDDRRTLCDG